MANKKENEKAAEMDNEMEEKSKKEPAKIETATENESKVEGEKKTEAPVIATTAELADAMGEGKENEEEEQLSSLDILWHHAFGELDAWAAHADQRDETFLKEAMYYVDSIKRNQGNLNEVREQFNREFSNWERTAREEFLMSTTSLQHFFPIKSYEEINQQIDNIQKRTMSILSAPLQMITNLPVLDNYLKVIEQYIALRKKGRLQYLKMIKQAANLIYENQKGFVNLFSRQMKTLLFPLNKYLEKTEEHTLS